VPQRRAPCWQYPRHRWCSAIVGDTGRRGPNGAANSPFTDAVVGAAIATITGARYFDDLASAGVTTSPLAPASEAGTTRVPVPLRERRYDWFFIIAFAIFVGSSFTGDIVNMVARPDPDSGFIFARLVYHVYAGDADPLLIANPRFLQVGASISALVFGTFYLVAIYAFAKGREWIRLPSFIYTGMIVQTTFIVLMVGFTGDATLFRAVCGAGYDGFDYTFTNVARVLAYNLPYIVVPVALTARMWRAHPFTRPPTST